MYGRKLFISVKSYTKDSFCKKYDRYPFVMKKVCNWSESHLSRVTLYKIHILIIHFIRGCLVNTFQDFSITEHMKPCMHILEINISSLNHIVVRPTKTPKSADKKCKFLTLKVNFLCQKTS